MNIRAQIMNLIGKHSILIVAIVLAITGYVFSKNQYETVCDNARSLAYTVACYLDTDKIEEYATTKTPDDAYYRVEHDLKDLKENFPDCQYMYVITPTEDNQIMYIFDIYTNLDRTYENYEPGELGYTESVDEEKFQQAVDVFEKGEETLLLDIDLFNQYGALAGYYIPLYGNDAQVKAVVGIDYSISDFVRLLTWTVLNVFILFIIAAILLAYYEVKEIDKMLVRPIKNITSKATKFVNSIHNGDSTPFRIETRERASNELNQLTETLNTMMADIDVYVTNLESATAERERISAELDLAEKIQQSALPSKFPAFPERNEFDLYALMDPAKEVGGDFYDFFLIDENHLALVIADVSGKGIGASLFMMASKILLNNHTLFTASPAEVLRVVNNRLCENNTAEMFVTAWLGILDIETGKLVAANAGHEFPAIKKANGDFSLFKDKHGFVLGGMPGLKYKEYEIQMEKGDILYVYTDGVTEATSVDKELFGTTRMIDSLNQHKNKNVENILRGVVQDIEAFVGEGEQFDDITMLAIEYKKDKNMKEKVFRAKVDALDEVQAFLEEELENLECPMKHQMKFSISLEEMFVNVASYAYKGEEGDVTIQIGKEDDSIFVSLIDQGEPFDPLKKVDPDVSLSADERAIGGLGIFMVKKSMDEVHYEYKDNSNIFTMKKKVA